MNFSMFLPQMDEVDTYDASTHEADDINSVIEYFQVALGYEHTANNKNNDSRQHFHLVRTFVYFYKQEYIVIKPAEFSEMRKLLFSGYQVSQLQSIATEINTPPPDTA